MKLLRGGEFLITHALPEEIFTPEDFTQEQRLIAQSADEFTLGELISKEEELSDLNPALLKELLRKAGDLGFLSADIPERYGGTELDKVSSGLITERIGQGPSGFLITYVVQTGIGSLPIVLFGTPDQKKRYLPKVSTGELVAAYALTEPEHGSDALGAKTTAVLSDDATHYRLNGQKQFISNAGFADFFVTYAQIDETKFTSFILERTWEGVSLDEEEKKMGVHGSSTRAVIFRDVKVPIGNVLGAVGKGHVVALNTLNVGRYKLGAWTLGLSKLLICEAIKYAKGRIQFGKPIGEFGLIKHKIAEMVIKAYVTESMLYRTGYLLDLALEEIAHSRTDDSGQQAGEAIRKFALECSINKVFGSETLDYVADESLQIMGGYGYIQGNPVESAYRDSRINRIWEGTNEINRLVIIDMLIKAALAGDLLLFEATKAVTKEIRESIPERNKEDEGIFKQEQDMVIRAKKIVLYVAGAAIHKYTNELQNEQETVALMADSIIEIYAMESALLRAMKKIRRDGEHKGYLHAAAMRVYVHEAFSHIVAMAQQIFASLFEGEECARELNYLEKWSRFIPVNAIALRRQIAESTISAARYSLTNI